MESIINFAHRGASAVCPENTMAAFARSLELGATGIETDVQLTRDGRLVLIHDETLSRTTNGSGWVKDYDLEELRKLGAGSWFHPDFAQERLPLLEELLELVKDTGTVVNIELKNTKVPYAGLEEKVIGMVRSYNLSERIVISSFNHYSLRLCKELAPEIRTGILYMEGLYEPWEYARSVEADALHAYHFAVLPEFVAGAKAAGKVYHPWTVNEEKEMQRLIDAGAAGIITDYPDKLAALQSASVGS
ncbi:glycerophosphoryl diester phosphodiesterase [Paenibacillus rhizosphaerae]|uniref:Glycerophosphoryl diester phosphodiesterase n=1 Tax=Paenibacillus rhizosphaerae TaxID=297318 RepID=A0A839TLM7_9BACL|nr:glycerophosphodiester phosphodiesterase [Paenibacillus rhizosphaerae]MBB3127403.1 glycerophosphoryl diester phosphodiesterase [Paenibacillus rhizosphaerae]